MTCQWEQRSAALVNASLSKAYTSVALGPKLFLCGIDSSSRNESKTLRVVEINTEDGMVKTVNTSGTTPPPMFAHSAVLHLNLMVVFGGQTAQNSSQVRSNNTYALDLASKEWLGMVVQGKFPKSRAYHSAHIYDDFMYVFGGRDSGTEGFNDVYRLHVPSLEWSLCETGGSIPTPRYAHGSTLNREYMIVYGGCSMGKFMDDLYILNLESEIWTRLSYASTASINTTIMFPACLVFFETLHICGNGGSMSMDISSMSALQAEEGILNAGDVPTVLSSPVLIHNEGMLHLLDEAMWLSTAIPEQPWNPNLHHCFPRSYRNALEAFMGGMVCSGIDVGLGLLCEIMSYLSAFEKFY